MKIRDEQPGEADAIRAVVAEAFIGAAHSSGTEAAIVDALRTEGALDVSLVADDGPVVGHVAFSPVTINGKACGWFGLGPIAILPSHQGQGIGAALIQAGLERLLASGALGCVVLGDPAYYGRFGFEADSRLVYPGVPPEYFQRLAFQGEAPAGQVAYHPGFDAA